MTRGHEPKPPASSEPDPKSQSNLTDPDSHIMRKSKNDAFAQAYNAQLAVDADGSQLVLGAYVSQISADNNELKPMLEAVSQNLGQKVTLEWNLVCVAYNLKRLHKLLNPANQKPKAPKTPQPIPSALEELLGLLLSHYCPALQ